MDNLTHSLIGAVLGQAGLKRKTGLAMPALIIAANIPDLDAVTVVYGVESLAMRRGITHGPIAMVVLPLLLAGGLWWFDQWQAKRGKRPEGRATVHFGWLLALSVIGCLSHPLFDWFNNYGVRLLEPFSSQWFYGDTLFIIDPWIIAMLGAGIWLSLRRERHAQPNWTRPARVAATGTALYAVANLGISVFGATPLKYDGPELEVANTVPIAFWQREVLWRIDGIRYIDKRPDFFGRTPYSIFEGEDNAREENLGPINMSDPRIALWAKDNPAAQAFLFWSRMPVAELHEDRIILRDQRFMDPRTARQFSVTLTPPR